jgi:hypothetical protein
VSVLSIGRRLATWVLNSIAVMFNFCLLLLNKSKPIDR